MTLLAIAACLSVDVEPAPSESGATDSGEYLVDPPECAPLHLDEVASWEDEELPVTTFAGSVWPGAAIADVTGDGLPDVIGAFATGVLLFRNLGSDGWEADFLQVDGGATDYARSIAAADLDDDGDVDLFLGGELPGPSRFLINKGDGTFTSTPLADFDHRAWSAAFGDFTGDGLVDLFIATYDAELSLEAIMAGSRGSGQALVVQSADHTWHVAEGAVPDSTHDALSLQGAPLDYDNDGDLDVYLADDFGPYAVPNELLVNDGTGRFTVATGIGADIAVYAMGAGVGDANGDGHPDLFISDVGPPHYLMNDRGEAFVDATQATGAYINPTPTNMTSWGVALADMDQDAWDDVLVSYGGLGSAIDITKLENADPDWTEELDESSVFLHNDAGVGFTRADEAFTDLARSRGLAVGDLDLDGRPDLVTFGKIYLHIFTSSGGCDPGVTVKLHGPPGNPEGFGARVEARVNGRLTTRWLLPGVTAGQSALEVYVGTHGLLATDLTVTWPGGAVTPVGDVEAGSRVVVELP